VHGMPATLEENSEMYCTLAMMIYSSMCRILTDHSVTQG
jgi:hypothetical protein